MFGINLLAGVLLNNLSHDFFSGGYPLVYGQVSHRDRHMT